MEQGKINPAAWRTDGARKRRSADRANATSIARTAILAQAVFSALSALDPAALVALGALVFGEARR